jgi:hypothetical protein
MVNRLDLVEAVRDASRFEKAKQGENLPRRPQNPIYAELRIRTESAGPSRSRVSDAFAKTVERRLAVPQMTPGRAVGPSAQSTSL